MCPVRPLEGSLDGRGKEDRETTDGQENVNGLMQVRLSEQVTSSRFQVKLLCGPRVISCVGMSTD